MQELRCKNCNKLLGKVDTDQEIGYIELLCTRCKKLNKYGREAREVQED
jgi:phage FluMu protein Com